MEFGHLLVAVDRGVTLGRDYAPNKDMGENVRQQWYSLTIGEEVSAVFLRLGLEGWKKFRATVHRNTCRSNEGVVLSQHMGTYTALLAITGALLSQVVQQTIAPQARRVEEDKERARVQSAALKRATTAAATGCRPLPAAQDKVDVWETNRPP